ncbi:MAG: peptidase S41 [Acidobacteria bacterium RIFCSPLOWO2_12_FULL_54_10]|nr:MAG: peptidase S41 [Acidobacteria bacterium RIFCSPLOWO2_12_FULL_54_10]
MKLSMRGFFFIPLVILLCAYLGGVYGPQVIAQNGSDDQKIQKSLSAISQVLNTVEQQYADPVEVEKVIFNGAIPGMLRTLDPHSNFFDPKSFALLREDQQGRYYGVGMTVTPRNGKTIVLAPFVGSPAYKAGLRPGDVIYEVDGTKTEGKNTTEVADLLKGPKGTKVRIMVIREGSPDPLEFSIVRDEIPRRSIDHAFLLSPDVGYIRIASFNENTSRELREEMQNLNVPALKGMVLDLRNNPGGLLAEGVNVTDLFLEKGQLIVSHRGRSSPERKYTARRGGGEPYPLVVIMNRYSASAAEILAGAIQDHDRGLIIGEASFGKGLVQTVYPLSQDSGLALTTAKYYTPSGRLIQRDYSSVSLYDYYYHKENVGSNSSDVRKTDAGRPVYGGGGISPDVEVGDAKLNPFQEILARQYAFFNFAKRYLAENKTIDRDFEATKDVLDRFQRFLQEEKVEIDQKDFEANLDYIKHNIKTELTLSIFGMNEAFKLQATADPQIQKAVELLPQAAALLENAKQMMAEQKLP